MLSFIQCKILSQTEGYFIFENVKFSVLNGFILNKNELIPTAVETWEGVRIVIDDAIRANDLLTTSLKPIIAGESLFVLGRFINHKIR